MNTGPSRLTEAVRRKKRSWLAIVASCALGLGCSKTQGGPDAPSGGKPSKPAANPATDPRGHPSAAAPDKRNEVRLIEASAKAGNYTNQFKLGMMFVSGQDVEQDDFAARKWLSLAAEQGYATAQWQLGVRMADSRSIIHDTERAAHWLRRAADQDVPDAQYLLGLMYYRGGGTAERKDFFKAGQWLARAADKGHAQAMLLLGQMSAAGEGTTRNPGEAVRRFEQAALRGNTVAQRMLGLLYANGVDGAPPNPIEAARWLKAAADSGDVIAMREFGVRLASGDGTPPDLVEAYKYLVMASKHPEADLVGIKTIHTPMRAVEQRLNPQQLDEANRRVNEAMKNSAKPMAGP